MKKVFLTFRTLRHLKPVQILNRVWRRLPSPPLSHTPLELSRAKAAIPFPKYFATWNGNDEFTFIGETHRLDFPQGWNDSSLKKLWLYNLHYFDYLRQHDGVEKADDDTRDAKIRIMLKWIDENPPARGNGWEPYTLSLRIVNWIKFLLAVPDATIPGAILSSLALQAASLAKQLEYHLLANHLLANAKALVFAGKFFKGRLADKWYATGMAIYRKELGEQVLADGIHFERSAMYHSIILEDILDCLNYTGEKLFMGYAEQMLRGLEILTAPDGQISLINDAAHGIALEPATLSRYARALSVTPNATPQPPPGDASRTSGIVRLANGTLTLIAKCGDIGPSYQPGHAHADSLTFELWDDDAKIITDTGTDRYVVDDERRRQRSTAAHNTAVINGQNSSEVWAGHRVGRRATTTILSASDTKLAAEHNGYSPIIHKRTLKLDGNLLRGRDEFFVRDSNGKRKADIEIRFHLSPETSEDAVKLACDKCEAIFEPCEIAVGFGHVEKSKCAILRMASASLPTAINWTLSGVATNRQ